MAKGRRTFHFSPSVCHQRLMDEAEQPLAYRGGDVKTWQRRLRRKLRQLVGFVAPKERVPLNVQTLWQREHELGTVEKIVFTAEPCSDVTAFVCLPRDVEPPHPYMICLQGHSTGMHVSLAVAREDNSKPFDSAGDRDFAVGCMARGVAALCIEQRSFGERREQVQEKVSQHGCHDAAMHALMLGRTLCSERVFDVDRGIDYLAERGDADMKRIGVMGNSGGGTISIYASALLPRLSCAMPSCAFCTYRECIMSIYHCSDNYIPGLYPYADMADVMGLFAPRPVVIVAGKEDPIFPIAAVRRAFRQLKRIYEAAGAGDRCHLVVGQEGHRFYADKGWRQMLREIRRLSEGR